MYNHVLVAVDLSDESTFLLEKAAKIAKRNDAKLSIIHVDVNFSDLYTGLIDVNMSRRVCVNSLANNILITWWVRFTDVPLKRRRTLGSVS